MGDKLTEQEIGFVKDLVKTGNATQAVKNNFDIEDDGYARLKGHRLITKDNVKNAIQTLADRIPDDLVTEKHLALLNKVDKEGNIDVQAVSKGLEMAHKMKGVYTPDENKNINILMPVLVKFLNKKDDEPSDNRDSNRIQEII